MHGYGMRLTAALLVVFFLALAAPSPAQLVLVDQKMRVTKVDKVKNRLEATNADRSSGITYILIDGSTKVHRKDRLVPWTQIQSGMIIRVKGGMTWDMKVKARDIWIP